MMSAPDGLRPGGVLLVLAVLSRLESGWSDGTEAGFDARRDAPTPCPCTGSTGDCAALASLYTATRGAGWANATGWCDGASPCSWHGVTCCADVYPNCPGLAQAGYCAPQYEYGGTPIRELCPASCGISCPVSKLNLVGNQLEGSVPGTIAGLTQLTTLYLETNRLSGAVPVQLSSLTKLTWLALGKNSLSGTVPVQLSSLTQLIALGLETNSLSGAVPVELSSLTKLTELALGTNRLSGAVPVQLSSLTKLTVLGLGTNSLSGAVPVQLSSLTQLTAIYLDTTSLSGVVPVQLSSLTKLTQLVLDTNRLSGTVPVQLSSLTQLTELELGITSLSGVVPVQLSSLTKLTVLGLGTNRLSGSVPVQLSSLTKLTWLALGTNSLSGAVPVQLSSLTQLTVLGLGTNRLSGSVPVQLSSLTKLTWLALGTNSLSGAVPVQLSSLTQLTQLGLGSNSLSGAVPVELSSLTQLTALGLETNRLSGVVPVQLSSLTQLTQLALGTNSLSGAVPVQLSSLTKLTTLYLDTTSLSGVVPVQLSSLTQLTELHLETNRLSGTVPVQLSSLTQLTWLALDTTSLSGTVPVQLSSLTQLTTLYLDTTSLSGVVPVQLSSLTKLTWLGLDTTSLSGSVPVQLSSLTQLTTLYLGSNRLSGVVPVQLSSLTQLTKLHLETNRLSGTVPVQLSSLTQLTTLHMNKNTLSGSLLHLPLSLQQLTLHQNQLSGDLPSFANFSHLKVLTLFGNSLRGRLRLPHQADQLQVVAVHRNRLSCPVEYNSTSYNLSDHGLHYQHGALIAPGNRFSSSGKPAWALMNGVRFQWVPSSFWSEWRTEICVAAVGVVATAVTVGVVLKANWWSFFCFRVRGLHEQYSWLCTRLLLGLGVLELGLVLAYTTGAGEFECGHAWLRATLAYLSGNDGSEEAAAVLICVAVAAQTFAVLSIRDWGNRLDTKEAAPRAVAVLSWQRWLAMALVWPVAVLCLSVPSFLSTVARSVPGGQNTMGLSQPLLDGFEFATSPLLSFIDTVLLPTIARRIVSKQGRHLVVGMLFIARFVILLAVPFATAVVLGSDCYGLWVQVWEPCQGSDSFNMQYTTQPYDTKTVDTKTYETSIYHPAETTTVTHHADVCEAQAPIAGRCPRFVIESLAELIVSKLAFTVFVSPVLTVILKDRFVAQFGSPQAPVQVTTAK